MNKRLLALLLAVCMLLNFVPTASFAAGDQLITHVVLSDFTEPVYGAHPDFDLSVPAGAHYHLASREELMKYEDRYAPGAIDTFHNGTSIQWPTTWGSMTPEDTYTEEGVYFTYSVLIPDPGYKFADNLTGTFNGKPVSKTFLGLDPEDNGKRLTVTHQCPWMGQPRADITFQVVNGTWEDGRTQDRGFELILSADHKGTLKQEDIPTGMKPFPGYTEGSWNVEPTTEENSITGDATFIYTFKEDETKAVVTFKVEYGSWSDKSYDDRAVEVQLTDGRGALTADQIPTGMVPAAHYGDGAWDVTPTTEAGSITGDTTYTYTFVLTDVNNDGIDDREQKTAITYASGLKRQNHKEENGFVTGLPESETVTWKKLADGRYSIPVSAAIPVRKGFIFDGWKRKAGMKPVYDAENHVVIDAAKPGKEATMTAMWKSPTGKLAEINYYAGFGGNRPNGIFYEEIPADCAYTPRTPQELGIAIDEKYVFLGWAENSGSVATNKIYGANDSMPALVTTVNVAEGTKKQLTAVYGIDSNKNGIADLLEEKLTVSFDMSAGVLAGVKQTEPIKAVAGETVKLPSDVLSGRNDICWAGWQSVPATKLLTRDDPRPEGISLLTVTKDTTLYAAWGEDTNLDTVADVKQTATVTYEAPGAKNVPAAQKVLGKTLYLADNNHAVGYPLDSKIPTMEGKVFGGWQCKEEPDACSEPGDDYIGLQLHGWPNITLVATWHDPVKSTYTLSFDGNGSTGGKVPAALTQQGYDDAVMFEVPDAGDLVRENHFFICWSTKADDTGDYIWPGDTVPVLKDTELKLYAIWEPSPVMHFEMPEADAGTVPADVYAQLDAQEMFYFTLPEAAPTRAGYEFLGYRVKQVFDDIAPYVLAAQPEHLDENKLYQPGAKIYCDDAREYKVTAEWNKLPEPVKPEPPAPTEPIKPEPPAPTEPAKSNPSTGVDVAQTGDESNILLWTLLGLVSACGMIGTVLFKKKRSSIK